MPNRQRGGRPTYAEHQRAQWQAEYDQALAGKAPPNWGGDAEDWAEALREIGESHGYIAGPTGDDEISARIRIGAGRGTSADEDVLRARARAHGEGRGS